MVCLRFIQEILTFDNVVPQFLMIPVLFLAQAPCTVQWGECDVPPSFPRHAKVQAGRVPLRPRGDVSTLYQRQQGWWEISPNDLSGLYEYRIITILNYVYFPILSRFVGQLCFEAKVLSCWCKCPLLLFQVPEDMQDKEFAAILQDEPMQPLALVPLTEEEQVCLTTHPLTLLSAIVELFQLIMWYVNVMGPQSQSKRFCWLTNVAVSSHS